MEALGLSQICHMTEPNCDQQHYSYHQKRQKPRVNLSPRLRWNRKPVADLLHGEYQLTIMGSIEFLKLYWTKYRYLFCLFFMESATEGRNGTHDADVNVA